MKKMLLAALAAGIVSTSAMAADTTISQIWLKDGTATIVYLANGKVCGIGSAYGMTADHTKSSIATLLTAKSSGATVSVNIDGPLCKNILLK